MLDAYDQKGALPRGFLCTRAALERAAGVGALARQGMGNPCSAVHLYYAAFSNLALVFFFIALANKIHAIPKVNKQRKKIHAKL